MSPPLFAPPLTSLKAPRPITFKISKSLRCNCSSCTWAATGSAGGGTHGWGWCQQPWEATYPGGVDLGEKLRFGGAMGEHNPNTSQWRIHCRGSWGIGGGSWGLGGGIGVQGGHARGGVLGVLWVSLDRGGAASFGGGSQVFGWLVVMGGGLMGFGGTLAEGGVPGGGSGAELRKGGVWSLGVPGKLGRPWGGEANGGGDSPGGGWQSRGEGRQSGGGRVTVPGGVAVRGGVTVPGGGW